MPRAAFPYPTLRLKIVLPPLLLLVGLLVGLGLLLSHWLQQVTTHTARSHAEAAARSLAAAVTLTHQVAQAEQRDQPSPDDRLVQLLDATLTGDPLLAYVQVRTPASTYTSLRSDAEGQALKLALQEIVQSHRDIRFSARRTVGGVPVVIARQGLADQAGAAAEDLFVAVSLDREAADAHQGLLTLLFLGAGAVLLYAVVLLFLLSGVIRRMERLARGVRRVEEGDLRTRVGTAAEDELGEVGRAFDVTTERLGQLIGHVRHVGQSLERTARDVAEAAGTVRRGAASQAHDTEDAAQSAKDFVQALSSSVPQIEALRDELRLLHTIAQRLASLSVESSPSLEEVERVVVSTGDGLRQLVASIGEVARSAGAMNETTAVTASAMADVKHSINRVRETAISAAGLAEQAGVDAERGTLVLGDSMAGIEHIREASRAIGQVTDDLQRRVGEIGDVLHLITELTQRTNLLALNASIIAAQAGAEGRGFAVVADEIKDLARRTAHSAGSIDSLLLAVAEGAHAARRAALVGGEAVESGATRARDAARTMTEILSRLRNWAVMAKSIATATEEQTRSAAMVMRSIQEVQGLAGEIAAKTGEQSRRGEYLHRHASRVQDVMESLGTAGQEQKEGTAQVADSLARLMRAAEDLAGTQRNRVAEGERVRGMVEIVRRIALGYRDAVAALDRTVTELRAQATALSEERAGPRREVEVLAEPRRALERPMAEEDDEQ